VAGQETLEDLMPRRGTQLVAALSAAVLWLGAPTVLAQQQESRLAAFGNLPEALNNTNVEIQALHRLDVQSIRVVMVDVGELRSGNNSQVLSHALNTNQANIRALQDFLNNAETPAGAAMRNWLIANQLVVNEVVALDVLDDSTVIVFYQLVDPGRMHKV
jgi:hypothetical protein